jgi:glycine/D-amino acid oxidase-like deaminating enzyme
VPGFEGLILATGHSNGNMTGPSTGDVVSRLVTGAETPDWLSQCAFGRPGLEVHEGSETQMS